MINVLMRYHVEPAGDVWKVSTDCDSRPESLHQTKAAAIAAAERLARKHGAAEVVVHRHDGSVEQQFGTEERQSN